MSNMITIPSQAEIDALTAGVMAGSGYRQALAAAWNAVSEAADQWGEDNETVQDAAAYAQDLQDSIPCQQGDQLLTGHLRDQAIKTAEAAR